MGASGRSRPTERYYNLVLRVMTMEHDPKNEDALHQEYADFCDGCVTSGKALSVLWAEAMKWQAEAKSRKTALRKGKA